MTRIIERVCTGRRDRTVSRFTKRLRAGLLVLLACFLPFAAAAAPFAAYVMDARSGKEIYAQNADTRLHPASLTKMMTLYLAFTAIERGQVRLDTKFLVSEHAASQPPSRLGLKPGQRIELRYLIRAAAVKSANDAATTIGEGLGGGSEAVFAQQMNTMARNLGMRNTHFANANGLTASGHYSSARDLSLLGRHLFYDFPQYYSIFSRRTADAGIANVASTNRRFLEEYEGADGIKTGYTRAAGFNLTASAQRGNKRLIATVLGGQSTAHRNQVMSQLLDAGFGQAPNNIKEVKPEPPQYMVEREIKRTVQVARAEPQPAAPAPFKISTSARPAQKTNSASVADPAAVAAAVRRASAPADQEVANLGTSTRPQRRPGATATASIATKSAEVEVAARPESKPEGDSAAATSTGGLTSSPRPIRRSGKANDKVSQLDTGATSTPGSLFVQSQEPQPETVELASSMAPARREESIILASLATDEPAPQEATEVVSRISGGGKGYGVSLGLFKSRSEAEQVLVQTALQESAAFGNASRRVGDTKRGFEANFSGMTKSTAQLACDRLHARQQECRVLGN
ncbi:D-alanyl-D-alanine carboxypeptidase family protein [Paracoccus aminophilus]|uniref:D-alanyl-D-alanine carboxypeptidase n=1 Tax=Paracoccus aminophilus JCM 7686 TaxID=1367847 RepID=S5XXQ0_PARAH|nr:serine hydrolase [Paracoccus aminophilus]AGT08225.1 D-alanyl-D-alanine carboxypeptidase [Paracoccus aminophilus JCM 7686]